MKRRTSNVCSNKDKRKVWGFVLLRKYDQDLKRTRIVAWNQRLFNLGFTEGFFFFLFGGPSTRKWIGSSKRLLALSGLYSLLYFIEGSAVVVVFKMKARDKNYSFKQCYGWCLYLRKVSNQVIEQRSYALPWKYNTAGKKKKYLWSSLQTHSFSVMCSDAWMVACLTRVCGSATLFCFLSRLMYFLLLWSHGKYVLSI